MSYVHLEGESNQDREKRLASEYEEYVTLCKQAGVEAINYMNWLASKKRQENGS